MPPIAHHETTSGLTSRTCRRNTRALRRYAGSLGFDLVRRGFYSPLPAVSELPPEVWTRRSALEGIHFESAEQLRFVRDNLAAHVPEFDPRFDTGTSLGRYDIRNLAYDE